jgi:uncharacterized iron-regulated protein
MVSNAQFMQDAIDKILFAMAGLSEGESDGERERLEKML